MTKYVGKHRATKKNLHFDRLEWWCKDLNEMNIDHVGPGKEQCEQRTGEWFMSYYKGR